MEGGAGPGICGGDDAAGDAEDTLRIKAAGTGEGAGNQLPGGDAAVDNVPVAHHVAEVAGFEGPYADDEAGGVAGMFAFDVRDGFVGIEHAHDEHGLGVMLTYDTLEGTEAGEAGAEGSVDDHGLKAGVGVEVGGREVEASSADEAGENVPAVPGEVVAEGGDDVVGPAPGMAGTGDDEETFHAGGAVWSRARQRASMAARRSG